MVRYLSKQIEMDLKKKMVFVGGPRQVGKTTLCQSLLPAKNSKYMNWDIPEDKENILKQKFPTQEFLVFDEIHKYRQWRNYLKGLFDQFKNEKKILVTGSARLDYYRYHGDSLQGRYHYLRIHPLSVAELKIKSQKDFLELMSLGGFPEPFFGGSAQQAKRWSREYRQRLIYDEVGAVEQIVNLQKMELLMMRLPELVGSPLSINALQEDLQASPKSIAKWVEVIDRMYGIFRISPFGAPQIRAVKKEQKHYHFDWSLIENPGYRFENLVASHLLKWIQFQQDTMGENIELRYFRDRDQREIDFVVVQNKKPILAIECKLSDDEVSKHLKYFKAKFPACRCIQLHAIGKKEFVTIDKIEVLNWKEILIDWI